MLVLRYQEKMQMSGCVIPENERDDTLRQQTGLNATRGGRMLDLRDQEKMQIRKQRQRTAWGTGMNPTGRYVHMFEERGEKAIYPNDNRDPYKVKKTKISPPYPHKRKNINYFSHSKDPYFL